MTTRRRRNRGWLWWVVFVVLLVMAGVVVYAVWNAYFRNDTTEVDETVVVVENTENNADTEKTDTDGVSDEADLKNENEVQYEGEDPNSWNELTGAVTYAEVINDILRIRVNIDQYIENGTCELQLTTNGYTYRETAEIVGAAGNGECRGFDVSLEKLWDGWTQIVVRLEGDGKTGEVRGEVEV